MTLFRKTLTLTVITALLFVLAGCVTQSAKSSNGNTKEQKIQLLLDWTPNTNHSGFFVALDKGYYAEAGLSVDISQPPEEEALTLLALGKADFAVGFQESMGPALASPNPLPITAVAAMIQHNTSGIISLKSASIQSPKDLAGKRFATWGTEFVTEVIHAIVEADGGKFEDVQMVPNNATDAISAIQTDVDAIWIYYGWDGIAAEQANLNFDYITLQNYVPALDFYTPILVSSDAYLKQNPDIARAFIAATAKGYEYAAANPDEAAESLLKHAPELDRELVIKSQQWLSGQYKADADRWGVFDPTRWALCYDWMYEKGLLEKKLGESGFTNEYLPE
jgi:ABC-type nitrate/sulfonate/bicarbonate transport system substrate-binding protein